LKTNDRAFEFSVDHFAGVTVNETAQPVPRQRPLAGRVPMQIAKPGPSHVLRDAAKTIPDKRFAVFRSLVTRGARAIGNQENQAGANKNTSNTHGWLGSIQASSL
jgi:hypothetical protein